MKNRIEFIDIAKGLAMFLVVWGHTASNAEMQSQDCYLITKILYSFHMPLFFFLSGLSISPKPLNSFSQWRSFLKKAVLTMAFPYLVWSLIYCDFTYQNLSWVFYASWYALGKVASLTSMWFLSCLFVSKVMVEAVISFTPRKAWTPIATVMLLLGLYLPKISIGYPWCLDIAFVATSCIMLGVILKNKFIVLGVQKLSLLFGLMILSAAVFAASIFIGADNFINMMMCKGQYGTGLWPFVRAVTGGFVVILYSMILHQISERSNRAFIPWALLYIGQCTIGIFILHKPLLQELVLPLMTTWFDGCLSLQLIRFFSAIIAMFATLPICAIILHYVPELIGVFSKDRLKITYSK